MSTKHYLFGRRVSWGAKIAFGCLVGAIVGPLFAAAIIYGVRLICNVFGVSANLTVLTFMTIVFSLGCVALGGAIFGGPENPDY